jgi:SAM-dependent methyltransferase
MAPEPHQPNAVVLEEAACGLCGSTDYHHLFEARDFIYGNQGSWPAARCAACGVTFMNPRIPAKQIGQFYPKDYYTSVVAISDPSRRGWKRGIKDVAIEHGFGYSLSNRIPPLYRLAGWLMLPFTLRWAVTRKYICPVQSAPARVLDVGCGNGQMLSEYRRLGWETHGVEPSESSARQARQGGHEVFTGMLSDAQYPDGFFDAVTMWDALEHIHNPCEVMAEVHRVLRPGGKVYISVPNFGSWYGRIFKDRWFMFTAPIHYYHYSNRTLTYLLEQAKFCDVQLEYPLGDAGLRFTLPAVWREHALLSKLFGLWPVRRLLAAIDLVAPNGHLLATAKK